jgi:hypothetical protein
VRVESWPPQAKEDVARELVGRISAALGGQLAGDMP